jgi:hypothetical protein
VPFAIRAWYRNGTCAAPYAAAIFVVRLEIASFVFCRCSGALLRLYMLCIPGTSVACWAITVALHAVFPGVLGGSDRYRDA